MADRVQKHTRQHPSRLSLSRLVIRKSVRLAHLLIGLIVLLLFIVPSGCKNIRAMGRNPRGEALRQVEALPNYRNGEFRNRREPGTQAGKVSLLGVIRQNTNRPKALKPSQPIPSLKTDLIGANYDKPTVIWFGHSSFLVKTATFTVLADPNFSGYAGPVSWMVRAFEGSNTYQVADLPAIDVLIISHDHYDHLDYQTIMQLKDKVKRVIVPMGVGSHFRAWGYAPEVVTELYWDQSLRVADSLRITATPARHFSNRSFANNKTLWASYVIEVEGYRLFFSGDGGYGRHFRRIGAQYGPFDLALMECGQYNVNWPSSHMFPEQTARAAADLQARTIIPVHWAKFKESFHPWNEPIRRLLPAADSLGIPVSVPRIGEPYTVGEPVKKTVWWDFD